MGKLWARMGMLRCKWVNLGSNESTWARMSQVSAQMVKLGAQMGQFGAQMGQFGTQMGQVGNKWINLGKIGQLGLKLLSMELN